MDHVPLPLKKIVSAPKGIMSDAEVLRKILEQVRRIKTQSKAEAV
jgi:formylmethanofuran dehydrogenase subunit B